MTDEDKIKKINELFDEFHSNMLVLMKKQRDLLDRVNRLIDEKKLNDAREQLKKM